MRLSPSSILRRRPSPATLVAVLALVVATGGTSYAAVKITGEDIQNNSITGQGHPGRLGAPARTSRSAPSRPTTSPRASSRLVRKVRSAARAGRSARSGRCRSVGVDQRRRPDRGPVGWVQRDRGVPGPAEHRHAAGAGQLPARQRQRLHQRQRAAHQQRGLRRRGAAEHRGPQRRSRSPTAGRPAPTATRSSPGRSRSASAACPVTACAPPGTGNVNHVVVSPRQSDGTVTSNATGRKRFYVIITGDSTDFVRLLREPL